MSDTSYRHLLESVRPEDLTAYLGAAGWKRQKDFPRSDLFVFESSSEGEEPLLAVFPASASARDFREHTERLVQALAEVEEREATSILFDIVKSESDRLRVRLIADATKTSTLPLPFAVQFVRSLHDLIVASACGELQPQPFYARVRKHALLFANGCRFAQTAPGSFVANVETPVTPAGVQVDLGASLGRRVTERILRGFGRLRTEVIDGTVGDMHEGYQDGLNANMCEALLPLRDEIHDIQMEIGADFSRRIPVGADVPRQVYLESRAFEHMASAARTLRGPGQSRLRRLTGVIVRLSAEPEGEDEEAWADEERWVTLRFVDGGRRQHARFQVDETQYHEACDAHRDRRRITVSGLLERIGKQWQLLSVRDFAVIGPDGEASEE